MGPSVSLLWVLGVLGLAPHRIERGTEYVSLGEHSGSGSPVHLILRETGLEPTPTNPTAPQLSL